MKKMRIAWLTLCLVAPAVAACGFPRLSDPTDGGGEDDGQTSDDGHRALDLELVAGDIGGAGAAARFFVPSDVAVDNAGNVYVADQYNHTIRKITAGGVVTTLAGTEGTLGNVDGTGAMARFDYPSGVAVDNAGNVFVADRDNYTIRKVTPGGVVTTLAGIAGMHGSADGTGAAARFYGPSDLAVDSAGNVYVADTYNYTIRKVTPNGAVTTLAGTAGMHGSADGTGTAARFERPSSVAVDGADNVYVADEDNCAIRKVTAAGVVTTLAGSAGMLGSADGTGAAARFDRANGVAVDSAGNVYVADTYNHTIRKVTADGVVTTLVGTAGMFGSADGIGTAARFYYPQGVAVDSANNVYVADTTNSAIRKVTAGVVTTLAGTVVTSGTADGTGTVARFKDPVGVAADSAGNLYVADTSNHTIRKVTAAGVVTTLAGTAGMPGGADDTGAAARFSGPAGVAVDSAGNLYVADTSNYTIRKVTAAGVVTTLAGTAGTFGSADGTGAAARFAFPVDVAVDSAGNVYVADWFYSTIRKVTPTGVVTTLVGRPDGSGTPLRLSGPSGVAVDSVGNIYVTESSNHIIRKVTPDGVVTTLAGTAGMPGSADGAGAAARFNLPSGVVVDSAGNVYVADYRNSTIRKVTPTGITTTVAGTAGLAGILIGATPRFAFPRSLAIVGDSIVISDTNAILLLRHGAR